MWLLDANINVHLVAILSNFGVASDTAAHRGWKGLSNGQLVAAAVAAGFDCLLTRDQLFAESAAKALKVPQSFAVVLVTLPQQRWHVYREQFLHAWSMSAIVPQAGRVIYWPNLDLE
jgi:predicted nuclease of predicted toxin-antitoxin system